MSKKIKFILISFLLTFIIILNYQNKVHSNSKIQESISDKIIRFHVIASSDRDDDQALKLTIKNHVLEYMKEPLSKSESLEDTKKILREEDSNIIKLIKEVIKNNISPSSNDPIPTVTTSIEEVYFPIKSYGNLTLPAGNYTAFRIILGEGKGSNWWCVLYPPLCFIDATHGIVPDSSREDFKALLTQEEYEAILSEEITPGQIKFKFKILKFLNP
ncbi:MAG: stage II sporulation protein R [Clostridiales bacterium]|nr:stage II sporulation protein R [Clostridiales bacterium]